MAERRSTNIVTADELPGVGRRFSELLLWVRSEYETAGGQAPCQIRSAPRTDYLAVASSIERRRISDMALQLCRNRAR